MIKAVVFDLDDTLVSEHDYIKSGYAHIAALLANQLKLDRNQVEADLWQLFQASPKFVFNRLLNQYGFEENSDLITTLVEAYRSHFPSLDFYPDVLPCLQKLKALGYKLGIITDGNYISQSQKLKSVKAETYFDEIIITDLLGRMYWKPHPRPFELMAERLGVSFGEMIYVGDNPAKDFYISRLYPIRTIRLHRDGIYKMGQYYQDVKEIYAILDLNDLIPLIQKID